MRVTVSDVMTAKPMTIRANQSVRAAAKLMHQHEVGFLVVLDDDVVVGVVTARDLISRVFAHNGSGDTKVSTACTPKPLTARPDDLFGPVLIQMDERRIQRVPVVDDGELVGLFAIDSLGNAEREPADVYDGVIGTA